LASAFLKYGETYGTITAQADGAASAKIAGNDLVLTGISEGSDAVSVYNDGILNILLSC
jgi:hypothetical protein